MLSLLRPRNEKDLSEKLFGKLKKYRLARNGAAVTVTGKLLALFRPEAEPDGLMPPRAGRVELLAVFLSKAGRYVVYYIVSYPETEDIAGRQEYVHACASLDVVGDFLSAMHYPNRPFFADAVLARAAKTLGVKPHAAAPEVPDVPAVPGVPNGPDIPDALDDPDATPPATSAATPGPKSPSAPASTDSRAAANPPGTPAS